MLLLALIAATIVVLAAAPSLIGVLPTDPSCTPLRRGLLATSGSLSLLLVAGGLLGLGIVREGGEYRLCDGGVATSGPGSLDPVVSRLGQLLEARGLSDGRRDEIAPVVEAALADETIWTCPPSVGDHIDERLSTSLRQTVVLACLQHRSPTRIVVSYSAEPWKARRWKVLKDALPPGDVPRLVLRPLLPDERTSPPVSDARARDPLAASQADKLNVHLRLDPDVVEAGPGDAERVRALSGQLKALLAELAWSQATEPPRPILPGVVVGPAGAVDDVVLLAGCGFMVVCRAGDQVAIASELSGFIPARSKAATVTRDRLLPHRLHTWQDLRISGISQSEGLPSAPAYRTVVWADGAPLVLIGGRPTRGLVLIGEDCNALYDPDPRRRSTDIEAPPSSLARLALMNSLAAIARKLGEEDIARHATTAASGPMTDYVGPLLAYAHLGEQAEQGRRRKVALAAAAILVGMLLGCLHALLLLPNRRSF